MKAGLNLFRPILGACSLRHKANWFSELRCADSLRPRMMVFATSRCARAVCHATAPVGERRSELSIIIRRGGNRAYPTPNFARLIPKAGFVGHARLRSGQLNAHRDHLNAPYWDQRGVSHSVPGGYSLCGRRTGPGPDTNSLKRVHDELVNRRTELSSPCAAPYYGEVIAHLLPFQRKPTNSNAAASARMDKASQNRPARQPAPVATRRLYLPEDFEKASVQGSSAVR
jgi:hypothetical protein